MGKSMLICTDVFVIGFIISFAIAALIKGLMVSIRYFFNRHEKSANHI